MDSLSIFRSRTTTVELNSRYDAKLDTVVQSLGDIRREQKLLRKGFEAADWEEEVVDMIGVDLDEINEEVNGEN